MQKYTVELDHSEDIDLPSVDIGPVSISKALRLLAPWRPTPMAEALLTLLNFSRSSSAIWSHSEAPCASCWLPSGLTEWHGRALG